LDQSYSVANLIRVWHFVACNFSQHTFGTYVKRFSRKENSQQFGRGGWRKIGRQKELLRLPKISQELTSQIFLVDTGLIGPVGSIYSGGDLSITRDDGAVRSAETSLQSHHSYPIF
jgi:hypothetical protein